VLEQLLLLVDLLNILIVEKSYPLAYILCT